jgi:hypothetical protein
MARFPISTFPENPEFGVDTTGQFGQTGFDLNQNPLAAPGVPTPPSSSPNGGQSGSSSGGPIVSIVENFRVKSILLNPALTSHYICKFKPPDAASSFFQSQEGPFPGANYLIRPNQELIELSCSEASLPGSSLMTNEINDDHTGVTERHAYRRQFDDRLDFTFYVDHDYKIINFFESWISYCGKEDNQPDLNNRNYFYRFNFPDDYQTDDLYVTKFERDVFGSALEYRFIRAYPINITSMPISYDASQLLKCTVSFTYSRYVRRVVGANRPTEPGPTPIPGLPSIGNPNVSPNFPQVPGFENPQFGTAPGVPDFSGPVLAPGVPSGPTTSGSPSTQPQPEPTVNKNAGSGAITNAEAAQEAANERALINRQGSQSQRRTIFDPTQEGNLGVTLF